MKLKLFIEYKGHTDIFINVERVKIEKQGKKNVLRVEHYLWVEIIPLTDISLAFMIDLNTMQELFRYEK